MTTVMLFVGGLFLGGVYAFARQKRWLGVGHLPGRLAAGLRVRVGVVGTMSANVVVLDYGSGNIRSAERALERAGADGDGHRRPRRGARVRRPARARCRGVRGVHGGDPRGEGRRDRRTPPRRRTPGARDLRRHAGAVRVAASSTASRPRASPSGRASSTSCTPRSSRTWAGTPSTCPRAAACSRASRTSASTSCTPTAYAGGSSRSTPTGRTRAPLVTWATHGEPFVAAVENGPLWATQFHPEKSGDAGAVVLRNWVSTL